MRRERATRGDQPAGEDEADPASSEQAESPFLFAVGCVRSGTTMLRAMLDSHPDVAVPPEAYFVATVIHRAARYSAGNRFDLERLLADITAESSFSDWDLGTDALAAVRADPRPGTVTETIARLYRAYATARKKPLAADRTPSNVLEIELLARHFPAARFVHLVRDGRDVVPSVITMDFGPDDLASAALFWKRRVLAGRAAGTRLGPERYLEVHYETLVDEPEAALRRLCDFAGINFDPAMLAYPHRASELLDGLRHPGHVQGVRRPPTPGLRDWRTTMTPHDAMLFEALAGDALEAFGYERSVRAITARVRVEAVAYRTRRTMAARARTLRRRLARRMASPTSSTSSSTSTPTTSPTPQIDTTDSRHEGG